VSVSTTDGCSWSASSSAGWIAIRGRSSGTGSGDVNYTVDRLRRGEGDRTGSITVNGQTHTVRQRDGGNNDD
jgi:hypothetical protein